MLIDRSPTSKILVALGVTDEDFMAMTIAEVMPIFTAYNDSIDLPELNWTTHKYPDSPDDAVARRMITISCKEQNDIIVFLTTGASHLYFVNTCSGKFTYALEYDCDSALDISYSNEKRQLAILNVAGHLDIFNVTFNLPSPDNFPCSLSDMTIDRLKTMQVCLFHPLNYCLMIFHSHFWLQTGQGFLKCHATFPARSPWSTMPPMKGSDRALLSGRLSARRIHPSAFRPHVLDQHRVIHQFAVKQCLKSTQAFSRSRSSLSCPMQQPLRTLNLMMRPKESARYYPMSKYLSSELKGDGFMS